jgi:hypothetical protein
MQVLPHFDVSRVLVGWCSFRSATAHRPQSVPKYVDVHGVISDFGRFTHALCW